MRNAFLSELVKFDRLANAAAAAQTAVTSDGLDLEGFEGGCFVVVVGSIATSGTVTAKLQQSSDDASGDAYADIEGTSIAVSADDDDNKLLVLDLKKATERYVRVVVTRGTADSSIDAILGLAYGAKYEPVTQSADVEAVERHLAPAEGTA